MGSTIATPPGPSLSTYLAATQWTYSQTAVPAGLTLIYAHEDEASGMFGAAFVTSDGQIILAFEGTDPASLKSDYVFSKAEDSADYDLFDGLTPTTTFAAAKVFVQNAMTAANEQGFGSDPIFVTGHSLGGVEAEYISSIFQLGGATFGAPGLPNYTNSSSAADLVNYVEYGDPIGNFASGMSSALPSGAISSTEEPGFAPEASMDHVGIVQLIGNPTDANDLEYASTAGEIGSVFQSAFGYTGMFLGYGYQIRDHSINQYSADLFSTATSSGTTNDLSFFTPTDAIESLDALQGSPGDADIDTISTVSPAVSDSQDFSASEDLANDTISVTQDKVLIYGSQNTPSDPGTDTISYDPNTGYVLGEVFSDDTTGNVIQFVPDNPVSDEAEINYQSGSDVLVIDNVASFKGTVNGFAATDIIDLAGIGNVTKPTLEIGNILTLQNSTGGSVNLQLDPSQDYSDDEFYAEADGYGGTDVILNYKNAFGLEQLGNAGFGGAIYNVAAGDRVTISAAGDIQVGNLGSGINDDQTPEGQRGLAGDPLGLVLYDSSLPAFSLIGQLVGPGIETAPFEVGQGIGFTVPGSGSGYLQLGFNAESITRNVNFGLYSYPETEYFSAGNLSFSVDTTGYWAGLVSITACYAAGTLIATVKGKEPIENLQEGDTVITAARNSARVIWSGHRYVNCRRHPKPELVWPVRVTANAFGQNLPCRDLWLSPDHAVFVNDVLIPIKYLINGATIFQEEWDEVNYYHIELTKHDVILAEGLPCESYLDTDARLNFAHGGDVIRLFPAFTSLSPDAMLIWEAIGYAPLITFGPVLDSARAIVNKQAATIAAMSAAA